MQTAGTARWCASRPEVARICCCLLQNHMYKVIYLRQPKVASSSTLEYFGLCSPERSEETGGLPGQLCGGGLHAMPSCLQQKVACMLRLQPAHWPLHSQARTCQAPGPRHAQPGCCTGITAAGCLRAWYLTTPIPSAKEVAARATYLPLANISKAQVRVGRASAVEKGLNCYSQNYLFVACLLHN